MWRQYSKSFYFQENIPTLWSSAAYITLFVCKILSVSSHSKDSCIEVISLEGVDPIEIDLSMLFYGIFVSPIIL